MKRRKDRKIQIISRETIINDIAKKANYYPEDVERVYEAFEKVIVDHLLDANPEFDIEVCITEGIKLLSYFMPRHTHSHPINGGTVEVPDKIGFDVRISRHWKNKKVSEYREMNETLNNWKIAYEEKLKIAAEEELESED